MPVPQKIKRRAAGGSAGAPASLLSGELAFNEQDNVLWYGKGDTGGGVATSIISIGGSGATGTWGITLPWANISGKPTTLSGYGITDAYSSSGGTISGDLTTTGTVTVGTQLNMMGTAGDKYFDLNVDDGTNNYTFNIRTTQNDTAHESAITIARDGAVTLFFDNAAKLATSSTGVTITGTATATTFSGALSGNATTATTATNLAGGVAGGIPYQTGAGATSITAVGTAGQALVSNAASAPAWTTLTLENLPDAAFKRSVRCATTADLAASTFSAGVLTGYDDVVNLNVTTTLSSTTATTTSTAGIKVGAVISGNANIPAATTVASITNSTTFVMSAAATAAGTAVATTFTQTIAALAVDGVTLALNDRVLVKDQTAGAQNGVYRLSTLGSTTVPWVLTRVADADSSSEIGSAVVAVDAGTTNGGRAYKTTFKTTDTLNTTAMSWFEIVYNSGSWGISITGSSASCTGNAATATAWATGRTISLTGDVTGTSAAWTGSGDISFAATLANSGVSAATYNNSATQVQPFTVDAKGRITATPAAVTITPAWSSITGKPTTLSGYGITDALSLSGGTLSGNLSVVGTASCDFVYVRAQNAGGGEGGEMYLQKPSTGSLAGDVVVDINTNSLRIFENGGSYRGVQVDLTGCGSTSPLLHANNYSTYALPLTGGTLTGTLTANSFIPTSNTVPTNGMYLSNTNTLAFSTNSAVRLAISSTGQVGIGTAPSANLHVLGTGTGTSIRVQGNASSDYTALQTLNPSGVDVQIAASGTTQGEVRVVSNHPLVFVNNSLERGRFDTAGNLKVGGTADRATTAGTNQLVLYNGTAPVGTLAGGCSFYSTTGEMRVMDAAGNATLLSPHDRKTNEWIYDSVDTRTGRRLRVNMERLVKFLDQHFGLGFVQETLGDL